MYHYVAYDAETGWRRQAIPMSIAERSQARDFFRQQPSARVLWSGVIPEGWWPQALFCDFDGTLIAEESLELLAAQLGIQEEIAVLTRAAMAGSLDFTQALQERMRLLVSAGATRAQLTQLPLQANTGVQEFADWAQQQQIPLYIVSGGFHEVIATWAERFHAAGVGAHRWAVDAKARLLPRVQDEQWLDARGKAVFLHDVCRTRGWNPQQVLAMGDGANDRLMLQAAGLAVGFKPKPVLQPDLDVWDRQGDARLLCLALESASSSPLPMPCQ